MSKIVVCALYRFVRLDNYEALRGPLLALMEEYDVRGTLLLANEGVNSTIAGTRQGIDAVVAWLRSDERLAPLDTKESLHDEINTSNEKGLRIPPGIQAELGKIYAEQQNPEMAMSMLRAEMETYPESAVLLQRVIDQANGGQ